jgi:hypothetical protein
MRSAACASVYVVNPSFSLSQPTATSIVFAGCKVRFGAAEAIYSARKFRIPKPVTPTWYYVTIDDNQQSGDDGSRALRAHCQAADTQVGFPGRTYVGAIKALPDGGAVRVLAGGWPAPGSVQVGK